MNKLIVENKAAYIIAAKLVLPALQKELHSGNLSFSGIWEAEGAPDAQIDIGVFTAWVGHNWNGKNSWKKIEPGEIDNTKETVRIVLSGTTLSPVCTIKYE